MHENTEEIVIEFSKKKQLRIGLFYLLFIMAAVLFTYIILNAKTIKIWYLLFSIMLTGISVVIFLKNLAHILNRDRAGLILNRDGILFKGTMAGRKAGLIKWQDVELLTKEKIYRSEFIFLKLKDPEKYVDKMMRGEVRERIIKNGIGITNDELKIDLSTMEKLIHEYYTKYKQTPRP
jgi:hypothetical protein